MSNTKYYHFHSVWTSFLILAKIQDGGLDGNYYWWRHRLSVALAAIKYTSCCWKDQRLSTGGKIVSKYCNLSKLPGRRLSAPSPLYQGGGYEFTCTSVVWLSRDIAPQSCVNLLRRFHGEGKFVPTWISGKLPTYPSPKSTLTLTSHLGQNVGLGEG